MRSNHLWHVLITASLATLLVACGTTQASGTTPTATQPSHYVVTLLDLDYVIGVGVVGINTIGQIAGTDFHSRDSYEPFLWTPTSPHATTGTVTDLTSAFPSPRTTIAAITDQGQVTAWSDEGVYRWTPSTPNGSTGTLTTLDITQINGIAGVNDIGQIVGATSNGETFLWTPATPAATTGTLTMIASINVGGAHALNDYGQIVGSTPSDNPQPALWTPSTPNGATGSVTVLGGSDAVGNATAINNAGQIIGSSGPATNPGNDGFVWVPSAPNSANGTLTKIDPLPGDTETLPSDINNAGAIIGMSDSGTTDANSFHPFIRDSRGIRQLQPLIIPAGSVTLAGTEFIGDDGQIIADSSLAAGAPHLLLLTPQS